MILPAAADTGSESDSLPNSPTPPVIATPPHLKKPKFRVLTIHLEKEDVNIEWVAPVAGTHNKSNTMDVTSSYLLGTWFEVRLGDLVVSLCVYVCMCLLKK